MRLVLFVGHRLEHFEAEQSATLPRCGQRYFQELQHVGSLKLAKLVQRFSFHVFAQNRCGGLTDCTTLAAEVCLTHFSGLVDVQFHSNLIATQRISLGMRARRTRQRSLVVGSFVVIQDEVVVQLFVHVANLRSMLLDLGKQSGGGF